MAEFVHWPKPYLLLSATCDEILSRMSEIWMQIHFVCDNNCHAVNLESPPPKKNYKEWQIMLESPLPGMETIIGSFESSTGFNPSVTGTCRLKIL